MSHSVFIVFGEKFFVFAMFADENDSDHFDFWCPSGVNAWPAVRKFVIAVRGVF